MLILNLTKSEAGQYPAIQPYSGPEIPEGYAWWPDSLERDTFAQYDGFIVPEIVRKTVKSYAPNTDGFEAHQKDLLAARKLECIADSKSSLAAYLLAHPMQWTDGKYYSITAEKQQQLTGKIMSATLAAQTGTSYSLTWNATGQECQAWTLENLTALAFAIDARVTSLVSYQQAQEVAMREASTLEALEAIPVDYDSVPLPGGETA